MSLSRQVCAALLGKMTARLVQPFPWDQSDQCGRWRACLEQQARLEDRQEGHLMWCQFREGEARMWVGKSNKGSWAAGRAWPWGSDLPGVKFQDYH